MRGFLQKVGASILHLAYPSSCLHCGAGVEDGKHPLCTTCVSFLELIDPKERCPLCFLLLDSEESLICDRCKDIPTPFTRLAAAFDYLGPAATLVQNLKYAGQTHLSIGLGAYLAAQFIRLDWPLPDLIVPMPIALVHRFSRGYNQSLLLAESLSELLKVPVSEALGRKNGDYSQASLNRQQRSLLDESSFYLKKGCALEEKNILLIDDCVTTGHTARAAAQVLGEQLPSSLYVLAVCRS